MHRKFLAGPSHQEMEGACGLPAWATGPAQGLDWNQQWPQDWHLPPCFSKTCGNLVPRVLRSPVSKFMAPRMLGCTIFWFSSLKVLRLQHFGGFKKGQGKGSGVHLETDSLSDPSFCSVQAILSMLQDMNFINNYKIDCPTLARCVPPALRSVCQQPRLCLPLPSALTSIAPCALGRTSEDV